jgi:glycosyltransferase involved in cell wall biosynthesis
MFFPNYVSLDITHFETQIPSILESNIWKKRVALYVGVMSISWEVVFNLSSEFTDWNFVIVIPAILKRELNNQISNSSNVFWINGVERKYVPSLIKNCDLFLVPYVKGFSDKLQWGLTVKYLTAMYYKKLILAINDNPNLVEYGISICNDELELINSFKLITRNINKEYDVELLKGDWMQNAEFLLRLL